MIIFVKFLYCKCFCGGGGAGNERRYNNITDAKVVLSKPEEEAQKVIIGSLIKYKEITLLTAKLFFFFQNKSARKQTAA